MATPSRAWAANTAPRAFGRDRKSCAVKNDLANPTSEPMRRAASCAFALKYSPRVESSGSSRVSYDACAENDDRRTCVKT